MYIDTIEDMTDDYFSRQHRSSSSDPLVPLPEDAWFTPGALIKPRNAETSSLESTVPDEEPPEHPSSASSMQQPSPSPVDQIVRPHTTPPKIPLIRFCPASPEAARRSAQYTPQGEPLFLYARKQSLLDTHISLRQRNPKKLCIESPAKFRTRPFSPQSSRCSSDVDPFIYDERFAALETGAPRLRRRNTRDAISPLSELSIDPMTCISESEPPASWRDKQEVFCPPNIISPSPYQDPTDPYTIGRRIRPSLCRSGGSEVSFFESDSDAESVKTTISGLFRRMTRRSKKKEIPACGRSESFTTVVTVSKQREIIHLRNTDQIDLLIYESYSNTSFILAGTLQALLNEYTKEISVVNDNSFMEILIDYHILKLSTIQFCNALIKHFWAAYDAKDILSASRTVEVLNLWINGHPELRLLGNVLDILLIFLSEIRQVGFKSAAADMEEILLSAVRSGPSHILCLDVEMAYCRGKDSFFDFDIIDCSILADYLFTAGIALFRVISCVDIARFWLFTEHNGYRGDSAVLKALDNIIRRNSMIEHWTIATVLTHSSALFAARKMVDLADQLRTRRDFNTLFCIVKGLSCPAVIDFLAALGQLDEAAASSLSNLISLCSDAGDFFALRRSANIFAGPAVPYFAIYLNDLSTLPASEFIAQSSAELIDIDYFRLIHAHLTYHRKLSSTPDQNTLGSTSYVLRLYAQGIADPWTSSRTGSMDPLSKLFEQDLLHAWTKFEKIDKE